MSEHIRKALEQLMMQGLAGRSWRSSIFESFNK
jgi:hypothetical protein